MRSRAAVTVVRGRPVGARLHRPRQPLRPLLSSRLPEIDRLRQRRRLLPRDGGRLRHAAMRAGVEVPEHLGEPGSDGHLHRSRLSGRLRLPERQVRNESQLRGDMRVGALGLATLLFASAAGARDVTVHVRGDAAEFQVAVPSGQRINWKTLCTVPCTTHLAANGWYRLAGPGVHESPATTLPKGDDLTLVSHVKTDESNRAADATTAVGFAVTILGGAAFFVGLGWAGLEWLMNCNGNGCDAYDSGGPAIATLLSAVVALAGAIILVEGAEAHGSSRLTYAAAPPPILRAAAPEWARGFPQSQYLPIVDVKF